MTKILVVLFFVSSLFALSDSYLLDDNLTENDSNSSVQSYNAVDFTQIEDNDEKPGSYIQ